MAGSEQPEVAAEFKNKHNQTVLCFVSPHPRGNKHAVRASYDLQAEKIGHLPTGGTCYIIADRIYEVESGEWGQLCLESCKALNIPSDTSAWIMIYNKANSVEMLQESVHIGQPSRNEDEVSVTQEVREKVKTTQVKDNSQVNMQPCDTPSGNVGVEEDMNHNISAVIATAASTAAAAANASNKAVKKAEGDIAFYEERKKQEELFRKRMDEQLGRKRKSKVESTPHPPKPSEDSKYVVMEKKLDTFLTNAESAVQNVSDNTVLTKNDVSVNVLEKESAQSAAKQVEREAALKAEADFQARRAKVDNDPVALERKRKAEVQRKEMEDEMRRYREQVNEESVAKEAKSTVVKSTEVMLEDKENIAKSTSIPTKLKNNLNEKELKAEADFQERRAKADGDPAAIAKRAKAEAQRIAMEEEMAKYREQMAAEAAAAVADENTSELPPTTLVSKTEKELKAEADFEARRAKVNNDPLAIAKKEKAEAQRKAMEEEMAKYKEQMSSGATFVTENVCENVTSTRGTYDLSNLGADALPPGEAGADAKTDERPLEERLASKLWKDRKHAYDEIRLTCEASSSIGRPEVDSLASVMVKGANDNNQNALKAACEAILAFVKKSSSDAIQGCAVSLTKSLIKNALKSPRTCTTAVEIILSIIEADSPTPVVPELLMGCKVKTRGVARACLEVIRESFVRFGARAMKDSVSSLHGTIGHCLAHTDGKVRIEAMNLIGEIYRWAPPLVTPIVEGMRSSQRKESEESFKKIDQEKGSGKPKPTVYLRCEKEKKNLTTKSNVDCTTKEVEGSVNNADVAEDDDLVYEMLPTVDLIPLLKKSNFLSGVEEAKWIVRKKALLGVLSHIGPRPKLKPSREYSTLLRPVRKVITNDKNVQCVAAAINIITACAEGLRKNFSEAKSFCGILLRKNREKHRTVKTAVAKALHALNCNTNCCYTLADVGDEILSCICDKTSTPDVRIACTAYVTECLLETASDRLSEGTFLSAISVLQKACEGNSGEEKSAVRAAYKALKVAATRVTKKDEKVVQQLVAEAMKWLKSNYTRIHKSVSATKECNVGSDTSSKKLPSDATKGSKSSKHRKKQPQPQRKKPSKGIVETSSASVEDELCAGADEMPLETSLSSVGEMMVGVEVEDCDWSILVTQLDATKWQERVKVLDAIRNRIIELGSGQSSQFAMAIFWLCYHKTKKFKDNNFNVCKGAFLVVDALVKNDNHLDKRCIMSLCDPLVSKIGDRRLGPVIRDLLMSFAEKQCGPRFLLRAFFSKADKIKAMPSMIGISEFCTQAVEDFTLNVCGRASVIAWAKSACGYNHKNAKVKKAAVALLKSIYIQMGDRLVMQLQPEVSKAGIKELEKLFSGLEVKKVEAKRMTGDISDEDDEEAREDLTGKISDIIGTNGLKASGDKNSWKKRKAALERISEILQRAGYAIELNKASGMLLRSVRPLLDENNATVRLKAIEVAGKLGQSIEGARRCKVSKLIISGVAGALADKKARTVEVALTALNAWITDEDGDKTGLGGVIPALPSCTNSINARPHLLKWMLTGLKAMASVRDSVVTKEFIAMVAPLVQCMQDRKKEVRDLAAECLGQMISLCRPVRSALESQVSDLKPASIREMQKHLVIAYGNTDSAPVKEKVSNSKKMVSGIKKGVRTQKAKTVPSRRQISKSLSSREKRSTINAAPNSNGAALSEPVFILQNNGALEKSRRAALNERKMQWRWEADALPRSDYAQILQQQMGKYVRADVVNFLFDLKNPSCQVTGMKQLVRAVEECKTPHAVSYVVNVMDLLLKWCSLRLCWMEHVAATSQLIVLMDCLFDFAIQESLTLSDYEASVLLPFLIEKLGNKKDRFSSGFRGVLAKFWQVYSPTRVAQYVLSGMSSTQSTSTHCQCLAALSQMIRTCGLGLSVLGSNNGKKAVRAIGKDVDSKKKDIRVAALNCLVSCWESMDRDTDSLLKMLGSIPDKCTVLIKEKMKHAGVEGGLKKAGRKRTKRRSPARTGIGANAVSSRVHAKTHGSAKTPPLLGRSSRGPESAKLRGGKRSPVNGMSTPVSLKSAESSSEPASTGLFVRRRVQLSPDGEEISHPRGTVAQPQTPPEVVHESPILLKLEEMATSIQALAECFRVCTGDSRMQLSTGGSVVYNSGVTAMKTVHKIAITAKSEERSTSAKALAKQGNILVNWLTQCGKASFVDDPVEFRTLSLALSTLMALFDVPAVAATVCTKHVQDWFRFGVRSLLDPRLSNAVEAADNPNYKNMVRAFNYLTIRVAEKSLPSVTFSAVLNLLGDCVKPEPTMPKQAGRVLSKIINKVCTTELKRSDRVPFACVDIQSLIGAVDKVVSQIDGDKDSSTNSDISKQLFQMLEHIANAQLEKTKALLDILSDESPSRIFLLKLLRKETTTDSTKVELPLDSVVSPTQLESVTTSPEMDKSVGTPLQSKDSIAKKENTKCLMSPGSEKKVKQLEDIFERIKNSKSKEDSSAIFDELSEFKERNPEVNIDLTLDKANISPYFLSHIKDELAQREKNRESAKGGKVKAQESVSSRMAALRAKFMKTATTSESARSKSPVDSAKLGETRIALENMKAKLGLNSSTRGATQTGSSLSEFRARLAKFTKKKSVET
eukprot:g1645.t1